MTTKKMIKTYDQELSCQDGISLSQLPVCTSDEADTHGEREEDDDKDNVGANRADEEEEGDESDRQDEESCSQH